MNKMYLNKLPILKYMYDNDLTVTDFCDICDMDTRTFHNYLYGDKPVHVKVLFKLARILDVGIKDLLLIK